MREIKFRAWDPILSKMYEVQSIDFFWGLVQLQWWEKTYDGKEVHKNRTDSIPGEVGATETDLEGILTPALMQYIELKDVNGKEVYQNDIVKITALNENDEKVGEEIAVIDFDRCSFVFAPSLKHRGLTLDELFRIYNVHHLTFEIIGNIYENPDLLEAK